MIGRRFVITTLAGRDLSFELAQKWRALQSTNPALAGPYFCPEFTAAVAAVRSDVYVALKEERGSVNAFFPHQRQRRSGEPVGGLVSDFQGVVARPELKLDVAALLKHCGLHAFDFDHMLASQQDFTPYAVEFEPSPRMDLSAGFAAYVSERRAAGSEQIKKCGNLRRKLEREVGPLVFVERSRDLKLLRQVMDWKSAQYQRTGQRDVFSIRWVRTLIERIHATETDGFAGRLSLLYAGALLIAGHFGMVTPTVWHYWFPSYDKRFAKYSPGLLLLLKMAERAPEIGVKTIELGKGMSLYKERLMNGRTILCRGAVELPLMLKVKRSIGRHAWSVVRTIMLNMQPTRRLAQLERVAPVAQRVLAPDRITN
jgi:CelD/BcsL family acetyltransferase involved in cellulose biosynthesis